MTPLDLHALLGFAMQPPRASMCCIALAFLTLVGCDRHAASSTPTASELRALVADITTRYRRDYLFPPLGEQASQHLNERLDDGAYDDLSHTALAQALTADLRSVTKDAHSTVKHDPLSTRAPGERVIAAALHSPGIDKVEKLPGNIGYLRITLFSLPATFIKAADAAMSSLTDTRALIIDVRDARGGHAGSVAHLCSYFLKRGSRVHLTSFVYPAAPTIEYWSTALDNPYLDRPVFVLTSRSTGSAAEGFAYQMQALGTARIVGETTMGGAHTGYSAASVAGFTVFVPTGRAVNPITKSNWERVGVRPDLPSPADGALETAIAHIAAVPESRILPAAQ